MRDEQMSAAAFEEQVLESIRSRNMLQPGDRVIAAVSGGADSMALLRFFLRRGRELGITLEAAHVNHGLRDAADADEAFVAEFCAKEGVKLHCHRARRQCERRSEEWARQLRYDFFEQLRKKDPAVKIATAHTLTDQAETLLFRLARGTGLAGAAGAVYPAAAGAATKCNRGLLPGHRHSLCAGRDQRRQCVFPQSNSP